MKGKLISISGPDGSGKSTLIEGLLLSIGARPDPPVVLWTRFGYTPGFEALKSTVRRLFGQAVPQRGDSVGRDRVMHRRLARWVWLAIACADLLMTYCVRVRAMVRRHSLVICDRYVWDALIDRQMFFPENTWAGAAVRVGFRLFGRTPDVAILLALPFEEALRRSDEKDEPFPDPLDVRQARHRLYDRLGMKRKLQVIDATRPTAALVDEVVRLIGDR